MDANRSLSTLTIMLIGVIFFVLTAFLVSCSESSDSDDSDETDAKPDIWMDWDDFEAKFRDLQKATDQLAAAAGTGDRETIGKQFGATGKTCKSCHKAYKN